MQGNNNEYTTEPILMRPSLDAFHPFGLISRAHPVTSKSNPLINVILKNEQCTRRSTNTSTIDVLRCLMERVNDWLLLTAYPLGYQIKQFSGRLI